MAIKYLNNHDAYYFVAGQMGELHPMHWIDLPRAIVWVKHKTSRSREEHTAMLQAFARVLKPHGIDLDWRQSEDRVIGQKLLDLFWMERSQGQCTGEDAGGFLWRCWAAMLGYPYQRNGVPYVQAIEALLEGA